MLLSRLLRIRSNNHLTLTLFTLFHIAIEKQEHMDKYHLNNSMTLMNGFIKDQYFQDSKERQSLYINAKILTDHSK